MQKSLRHADIHVIVYRLRAISRMREVVLGLILPLARINLDTFPGHACFISVSELRSVLIVEDDFSIADLLRTHWKRMDMS